MHQVQLSNQVYDKVKRRADEAGFKSIDEYVAEVLTGETQNLDHLFTPECLAHIDSVIARVKAGEKTYTPDEVDAYLSERRAGWIRKNGQ